MDVKYLESYLTGGIQHPNFFNGRILTAEDLRDEQTARRENIRRLGQAVGEGVAYGLYVDVAPGSGIQLNISAGLAVNRCGEPLLLPDDVTLPLAVQPPQIASSASPFAPCGITSEGVSTTTPFVPCGGSASLSPILPSGFALLTITSATGYSMDAAPNTDVNPVNFPCISRYEVEGVQFKWIALDGAFTIPTSVPAARYQSFIAADCFGLDVLRQSQAKPFQTPSRYGLIDRLRAANAISDCDVPLALMRVKDNQIVFLDVWAVRRALHGADGVGVYRPTLTTVEPFSQHAADRRRVEALAFFLQFQDQITRLRGSLGANARGTAASAHFMYLPSAGYLPVAANWQSLPASSMSFLPQIFFANNTLTAQMLDPAYVRAVLEDSFSVEAIQVASGALPVTIYQVEGGGASSISYIIFTRRAKTYVIEPPPAQPPVVQAGTLVVTVTDPSGKTVSKNVLQDVQAVKGTQSGKYGIVYADYALDYYKYAAATSTDDAYTYGIYQAIESSYMMMSSPSRASGVGYQAARRPYEINAFIDIIAVDSPAVYVFDNLAPGTYTVGALPIKNSSYKVTTIQAEVRAGEVTRATLALSSKRVIIPPDKVYVPEYPWTFGNGRVYDKFYIDPRWKIDPEIYEEPYRPKNEWFTDPPPDVYDYLEGILSEWAQVDPTIVTTNPAVYVNPEYDPTHIYDAPYAYVGTQDGGFYPLVMVAAEYSLPGSVPAERGGVVDLDSSALANSGLTQLDIIAAAPTSLLANAAGGRNIAASLIADAKSAANTMQTGFTRYAGIDAQTNDALVAAFGNDVGLANATAEQVNAALSATGKTFGANFAARLIERARADVPLVAWSIDTLALGETERAVLIEAGITSKGDLTRLDEAERANLMTTLNADEITFNRLVEDAGASIIAGSLTTGFKGGIADVPGVTSEFAGKLVEAGISTKAALATASADDVAAVLNVSTDEASAIIANAAGEQLSIAALKTEFNLDDASIAALNNAGISTVADLNRADVNVVAGAVNDATIANRMTNIAGMLANFTLRSGGF